MMMENEELAYEVLPPDYQEYLDKQQEEYYKSQEYQDFLDNLDKQPF